MTSVNQTKARGLLVAYTGQARHAPAPIAHLIWEAAPVWNGIPLRSNLRAICGVNVRHTSLLKYLPEAEPSRLCGACKEGAAERAKEAAMRAAAILDRAGAKGGFRGR